jgi:hypothetical protein
MTIQAGSSVEAAIQTSESVTPEAAGKFIEAAETKLLDIWIRAMRAQWVQQTFITHDTEILSAQGGPSRQIDHRRSRRAIESIRTLEAARRRGAKDLSSETLRGYSRAARSCRAS